MGECTDVTEQSQMRNPRRPSRLAAALYAIALVGILCGAFALRTDGLYHGLDTGRIYHPDTAKQISAANRFMQGTFYYKVGLRDYDGYPYFNSLLAAGIRYPFLRLSQAWTRHVADEEPPPTPPMTFKFVRVLNAVESTLAVLLICVLGRMLAGPVAGLLAAAMLACSPIDITTCHYANGDTAAALFGLLALMFAVRIYRHGHWADYVLATTFSVCSFSSKYYGTASAIPIITAHLLRIRTRRDLFSKPILLPVATMAGTAIAAFFLTTPGAISHPRQTILNIHAFMQYTSGFKLPEQYASASIPGRFLLSMKANLPVFVDLLGPAILVLACAFFVLTIVRRNRSHWVIASLPLFYIFIGLTMKPAVQPVYHTVTVPALILAVAVFISTLFAWRRLPGTGRMIGTLLALAVLLPLANAGRREALLFRMTDTRVLAHDWVFNNVPQTFRICGSKYSFMADSIDSQPGPFEAIAWVRSDFRELPEEGDPMIYDIALEDDDRLVVFRNLPTEVYLSKNPLLGQEFSRPFSQRIPAAPERKLILADEGAFYRTTHYLRGTRDHARREIYSEGAIDSILVFVRGGHIDSRVHINVAGTEVSLQVPANETRHAWLRDLRPGRPWLRRGYHYPLRFHCSEEGPLICLGLTDAEQAAMQRPPDEEPCTPEEFTQRYGIDPAYMEKLPYIQLPPDQILATTSATLLVDPVATGDSTLFISPTTNGTQRAVETHTLRLEPGRYQFTLHAKIDETEQPNPGMRLSLLDYKGTRIVEPVVLTAAPSPTAPFVPWSGLFTIASHPAGVRCRVDIIHNAPIHIEAMDLHPTL